MPTLDSILLVLGFLIATVGGAAWFRYRARRAVAAQLRHHRASAVRVVASTAHVLASSVLALRSAPLAAPPVPAIVHAPQVAALPAAPRPRPATEGGSGLLGALFLLLIVGAAVNAASTPRPNRRSKS